MYRNGYAFNLGTFSQGPIVMPASVDGYRRGSSTARAITAQPSNVAYSSDMQVDGESVFETTETRDRIRSPASSSPGAPASPSPALATTGLRQMHPATGRHLESSSLRPSRSRSPDVRLPANQLKRKRTSAEMLSTASGSSSDDAVDQCRRTPGGAYSPPGKRYKRESTTSSVVFQSRRDRSTTADSSTGSRMRIISETSPSLMSYETLGSEPPLRPPPRPPIMRDPPTPTIPTPLEPFSEAGRVMNFPLPQIDHQGLRPHAAEGYFSALEDNLLLREGDPDLIELVYLATLRVRERVDWDCRRLGLRLRYLRRRQAQAAHLYPHARDSEWERFELGE